MAGLRALGRFVQSRRAFITSAVLVWKGKRREADARIRTADPFITSEVLYQLSYVGLEGGILALVDGAV